MAEKVIRLLVDDMEDDEVEADAGTVLFGLDGKYYKIDLSKKNSTRLRACLQPFIEHARPADSPRVPTRVAAHPARKSGAPSGYNRDQLAAIRSWARRNGWPGLSDKGRVPVEILAAFEQATSSSSRNSDTQPKFSDVTG